MIARQHSVKDLIKSRKRLTKEEVDAAIWLGNVS